jgi:toluene monooxygenase system protein A
VTFCDLCQLVLSGGTPRENGACTRQHEGRLYIFCSAPCAWIFEREPQRYSAHESVVRRILSGKAPANLLSLLRNYFGLTRDRWGHDAAHGSYDWLEPSVEASRAAAAESAGEAAC